AAEAQVVGAVIVPEGERVVTVQPANGRAAPLTGRSNSDHGFSSDECGCRKAPPLREGGPEVECPGPVPGWGTLTSRSLAPSAPRYQHQGARLFPGMRFSPPAGRFISH